MRCAQVVGHSGGVVKVGDGRREMMLARQQNVLGAASQVGFVLIGERRDREGVPAEGVGIREISSHSHANSTNPLGMYSTGYDAERPQRRVVNNSGFVRNHSVGSNYTDR